MTLLSVVMVGLLRSAPEGGAVSLDLAAASAELGGRLPRLEAIRTTETTGLAAGADADGFAAGGAGVGGLGVLLTQFRINRAESIGVYTLAPELGFGVVDERPHVRPD